MSELNRVLFVEDDPDIRAIANLALELVGGFTVMICPDGEEALREAEGFAPDMILLDVMMPGMDGPAILKSLRELPALAATPAVFLSAKVLPTEMVDFESLGALGLIPKPFDPMILGEQLRAIWEQRHG